jgi:post-segregation antitoxin (ccd killing protein)
MPSINVYLPDDLHDAAKALDLKVSPLTQAALRAELARINAVKSAPEYPLLEEKIAAAAPTDAMRGRTKVKFRGKWLSTEDTDFDCMVAVTAKGAFAIAWNQYGTNPDDGPWFQVVPTLAELLETVPERVREEVQAELGAAVEVELDI